MSASGQKYTEDLFMKHLIDGRVMATFDLVTTWDDGIVFAQPTLDIGKDHDG